MLLRLEADGLVVHELYAAVSAELASGVLRAPVLVEMALIARFLERLGDHAVEVGSWIGSFTRSQDGRDGRAALTSFPGLRSWNSRPLMRRLVGFAFRRARYFGVSLHAM